MMSFSRFASPLQHDSPAQRRAFQHVWRSAAAGALHPHACSQLGLQTLQYRRARHRVASRDGSLAMMLHHIPMPMPAVSW